jgi:hypothetical protein
MSVYSIFLPAAILLMVRLISGLISAVDRKQGSYADVRRDILSRAVDPPSRVRCTVMDWRVAHETMTLVVHRDSSAMFYILPQEGAVGDPEGAAQGPARRFMQAVEREEEKMHATRDYREPPPGYACFWIVREDETLTSGDIPLEDIRFRMTSWDSAWGSGVAAANELLESYRLRRQRARTGNVAAGPRPV